MSLIENPQQLLQTMQTFDKMFNIVRIVDPVEKRVINHANNERCRVKESICYDFWNSNSHCSNCVSMRAASENNTFVKIEYNKDQIFMVMATPVLLSDHPYVMETLKDITDTGIVPDLKGKTVEEIEEIIENLNRAVITDELTQIYNRRFVNEKLPVDLYTASISCSNLTAIMIDIDNFKQINDTFGHGAGDQVLQKVAEILAAFLQRKGDWAARYGGDEFLMVLPGAGGTDGMKIAEQIRRQIAGEVIQCKKQPIHITVSSGVYTICPEDNAFSLQDFFYMIDKKLYQAKNTGKNTIIN